MEASLFYIYGFLLYFPLALALSLLFGYGSEYSHTAQDLNPIQPKKKLKGKKKESLFPPGKCAYCIPCQRYLLHDYQLKSHETGQDHIKRAKDIVPWFEFRDYDEGSKAKKEKKGKMEALAKAKNEK